MKGLIGGINNQINEAIEIANSINFRAPNKELKNILICGLGGSGIGGVIVSQLLKEDLKVPVTCINDYNVPGFVDQNTLIIASSYSGNTEETIAAVREGMAKHAEICVITSGGKLLEMAESNNWNHAIVPGGEQPRAMLTYSIIQQLYLLEKYGLIGERRILNLQRVTDQLDKEESDIMSKAKELAAKLHKSTIIIYSDSAFGGVGTRFRQQINENSKELCWNHVLPEMTHNELVGWAGGNSHYAPIYLATDYDHPRTSHRWTISKDVIKSYTSNINEIRAKGDSQIAQVFYLIHFTDWVSWFLSEIKNIDASEVDVIIHLKSEMSKK